MLIDLTLKVTPKMKETAGGNAQIVFTGHLGTHFDVMDKEFPLEYTQRSAVVFDVSHVREREIEPGDIDLAQVERDMFVLLRTGFIDEEPYGTQRYFMEHPQLSYELIETLLDKGVSIIGVDCSGIRSGAEHVPIDQRCADRGVFVVENLCNLRQVLEIGSRFTARTFPMHFAEMTGLPCRVVAEV